MSGFCSRAAPSSRSRPRSGLQAAHARAAAVPQIEAGMQLRQPDLHALGELVWRIEDEHPRTVERNAGVARVERELCREQSTVELCGECRVPCRGVALVLDRIPDGNHAGLKALQRFRSCVPDALEVL